MKNLDRYIDSCTDLLLEELVNASVIKTINKSEENKSRKYRVVDMEKGAIPSVEGESQKRPNIIQDFYDFRNIITNVYRSNKALFTQQGNLPPLSQIVDRYVQLGVIAPSWRAIETVRNFLDKAEDILAEEETKRQALAILKSNKVSFAPIIIQVLNFNSESNLKELFSEGNVINPNTIEQKKYSATPDFIINVPESKPTLLVDVKYRKSKIAIKELIDQAAQLLRNYEEDLHKPFKCIVIVYSYGQLDQKERDHFSFRQNMEKRAALKNKIFFVPVGISYLENLSKDLELIKNDVLGRTVTSFKFKSQPINPSFPRIDDHYYSRILDLNKNNIEIRVRAKYDGHWRFGVKFASSTIFPDKDERHPVRHPLIHLQKETNSTKISVTSYDESGSRYVEFSTKIDNYKHDDIIIKIYTEGHEVLVDILDAHRQRIIDSPISVVGHQYCWISAWADNQNPFEFDAEIIEYSL